MKIVISGIPYFANKLVAQLTDFDKRNRYVAIRTDGWNNRFRAVLQVLSADVVYMIGGTVERSGLMNLALQLKKKVVMHWVGTDVLNAKMASNNKIAISSYITNVTSWCEVDWIQDELSKIGIDAEIVSIASIDPAKINALSMPEKFSILSYVGKGREDFYGLQHLIRLAQDFPGVNVNIVGISSCEYELPRNIKLHGWVDDMYKMYKECVLYIRLPTHDGLAFSVIEALSMGRYVSYVYDIPGVCKIGKHEDLVCFVDFLLEKFNSKKLNSNVEGVNYIRGEFDERLVLADLVVKLCAV